MAQPSLIANGGAAGVESVPAPVTGRFASVYSEVQASRIDHPLPLPSVLRKPFKVVDGPASSAAGNPEEIAKLFPNVFGQPSALLAPSDSDSGLPEQKLKIGVVLSGGQAPGGHNVISGIFDYLQDRAKGSTMYGFRGGPAGIMKNKYIELTPEYIYPYRNQGGFDMIRSGRDKIESPEQVQQLIAELNEILAHEVVDEDGLWKKKLTSQSPELFDLLPEAIQGHLMLERDPHGNVQVGNLDAPVEEWAVGGTAFTSLMDVEWRHGMVNLSLLFLLSCKIYHVLYICTYLFKDMRCKFHIENDKHTPLLHFVGCFHFVYIILLDDVRKSLSFVN
ncbi:hypothetical protein C1H46_015647 [Malus baccata]|uniref:Phosphofructokinase domain-containing protein n=1 Tax=Malus baccata TaxID=106549 RepID=A0A540MIX5_MALBA|nr:hypothetical protein C1H46_015647 [Malus baccata]